MIEQKWQQQERRLVAPKNFPDKYPDANFTVSGLRWWIFNGKENGFDRCVVRIGGKVLIDLDRFEEWADNKAFEGASV